MKRILATIVCVLTCTIAAHAQRGANDWMTENGDAQRTASLRSDAKINKDSVAKPGAVQLLWKLKLKNQPNQLNNLQTPATLERLIGYRGFRMLGFVAGSGDNLITIDTDLGRLEWERKLPTSGAAKLGTLACPGGMTTGIARPMTSAIATGGGAGGFGRSGPAKSSVGAPGEGATTLKDVRPQQPSPPPGAAAGGAVANRPSPNAPPIGGAFGGISVIYALASDGKLHSMHLSNGQEYQPPVEFLPAGANANGLIIVNGKAFVVTVNSCNGVANGLWAYDFENKKVATWKGDVVGSAGAAFDGEGTVYVTTKNGVTAIDPYTLQTKSSYTAGNNAFTSTPVVFQHKNKTLIAAATTDGTVHLLDTANLSSAIATTSAASPDSAPGALASWQDQSGARWILVPTSNSIIAWKVVEEGGKISLQQGWTSRALVSPLTPTVINGVVFATSSGEFRTSDSKVTVAQRVKNSKPAVIYALDGTTGKELWNSGTTITSFAHGGAISGGMGQFYLTTYDGTLYAFGFPMEH